MSIFRRLATKKAAEFVEIAAEQVKPHVEVVKAAATNSTGIFANVLKGALCLVAGWLIIREIGGDKTTETAPSNIVINNYIYKEEKENDQRPE